MDFNSLKKSRVILVLSGERKVPYASERSRKLDRMMGKLALADTEQRVWHVGDLGLSPYSPTIQVRDLKTPPREPGREAIFHARSRSLDDYECYVGMDPGWV